jgi:hypothetical protein
MNWESSHRNDEIGKDVINFMRAPRLRAPPGYGGAVRCFSEIKVLDPPRGRPAGGGGNYHNWGYGGLLPLLFTTAGAKLCRVLLECLQ